MPNRTLKQKNTEASHHALCVRLGYDFKNPALLTTALTHRSANANNYERLEFLGDSLLNLCISECLYRRYPDIKEGKLSRMRANLVCAEALSVMAERFHIAEHMIVGRGERAGLSKKRALLADALEAIIGAMYVDGGFEVCRARVLAWYEGALQALDPNAVYKDTKSQLQEWLQARKMQVPEYTWAHENGEIMVTCTVADMGVSTEASARNRRLAEHASARAMLALLTNNDTTDNANHNTNP